MKYKKTTLNLKLVEILHIIFAICVLWVAITSWVQAFKCPSMTQTQLFLNIPHSVILDFKQEINK